jgi:hypothetical protein
MSLQRVAFSPLHTFTRATNETFFNKVVDSFGNVSYQLQTAPAGTAVQNAYDPSTGEPLGLQVFEQRTNLLTHSEDFSNAIWVKQGAGTGSEPVVTPNATTAPDGTLTADMVVLDVGAGVASSDSSQLFYSVNATAVNYTGSVWLKGATGTERIQIRTPSGGYTYIDLTTQWQRFETTAVGSTLSVARAGISIRQGLGETLVANQTVYIWGAQLEVGAFPTPYIKTEATTATRNASVAVINDIDESEWWNQSEGTFVVELTRGSVNAIRSERIIEVSDGTSNNRVLVQKAAGLNVGQIVIVNGGVTVINDFTISQALDSVKIAFNLTSSALKLSLNGGGVASFSETIPLSGFSQLRIGTAITGMFLNGHIAKTLYYPTAVSDAKLQELSTL